jgi:hypothetical protein
VLDVDGREHQDWLVVTAGGEPLDEEVALEDEAPAVAVTVEFAAAPLDVAVCAEASVVAPIDPSNTITPHAMTNAESVAATTVRRMRATRRARSARRARPSAARSVGWWVGMSSS